MILVVVQLIFLAALLVDLALFLPRVPKALCEIPIGMAGLVAVACTIRSFVQKLNRRDDPRHAERPLDAP
ncbi:MAG: hypothetical protein HY290_04630 [Planctomycetia bacterium]|nr:hypothetical protein [Planctomycetia bacterium]